MNNNYASNDEYLNDKHIVIRNKAEIKDKEPYYNDFQRKDIISKYNNNPGMLLIFRAFNSESFFTKN